MLWKNVRCETVCAFKKWDDYSIPHGDYDFKPVMHYDDYNDNFAVNLGQPIIHGRKGEHILGQREKLSKGDIAAINAMYPAD